MNLAEKRNCYSITSIIMLQSVNLVISDSKALNHNRHLKFMKYSLKCQKLRDEAPALIPTRVEYFHLLSSSSAPLRLLLARPFIVCLTFYMLAVFVFVTLPNIRDRAASPHPVLWSWPHRQHMCPGGGCGAIWSRGSVPTIHAVE